MEQIAIEISQMQAEFHAGGMRIKAEFLEKYGEQVTSLFDMTKKLTLEGSREDLVTAGALFNVLLAGAIAAYAEIRDAMKDGRTNA